jgi:hypothetical protein
VDSGETADVFGSATLYVTTDYSYIKYIDRGFESKTYDVQAGEMVIANKTGSLYRRKNVSISENTADASLLENTAWEEVTTADENSYSASMVFFMAVAADFSTMDAAKVKQNKLTGEYRYKDDTVDEVFGTLLGFPEKSASAYYSFNVGLAPEIRYEVSAEKDKRKAMVYSSMTLKYSALNATKVELPKSLAKLLTVKEA